VTVLQDIRDRVIELLNENQPSGLNLPTFTKRRWMPGEELEENEIRGAVLFHRETPERRELRFPVTPRAHSLAIQIVTAVKNPDEIDDALEAARAFTVSRLGGATLEGLVHEVQEGESVWEVANLGRIHGAVTTLWGVRYQTNRSNLAQRS
jgi:hypothetical protein